MSRAGCQTVSKARDMSRDMALVMVMVKNVKMSIIRSLSLKLGQGQIYVKPAYFMFTLLMQNLISKVPARSEIELGQRQKKKRKETKQTSKWWFRTPRKPGVGLMVRVAAWDPRVLSSSPVGR